MGKRYEVRKIAGRDCRVCHGPLHREGQWVPTSMFRSRSSTTVKGERRLRSWCSACENALRNGGTLTIAGYVPASEYLPFALELENRIGRAEAARRVGVGKTTWYNWVQRRRKFIQRAKAAQLLTVLYEVRSTNEVRHRKSIKRGTSVRGEEDRPYESDRDLYRKTQGIDQYVDKHFRIRIGLQRQREREKELKELTGY